MADLVTLALAKKYAHEIAQGIGIKKTEVGENNHLIVTYDDDTTEDAGEIEAGTQVEADPALDGTETKLESIEIGGVTFKLFGLNFKTMPSTATLLLIPNDVVFHVEGFYSETDGHGGYYTLKSSKWSARGSLTLAENKYLVALADKEGRTSDRIDVCRYGVRQYGSGTVDFSTITAQNTYADINSDIISRLNLPNYNSFLKFPAGRFFFETTINLSEYQVSVSGTNIPNGIRTTSYSGDTHTVSGTILYFPFLTDGQTGLHVTFGNVENLAIVGNPNTYKFHIDRTKTITAPNEVVEETIAEVDGEQVKCTGIKKTTLGFINNVRVVNFYTGIYCETANIYINNIFARSCHIGFTVGNDIKLVGVYGWDVHTLLQIRGAITSAHCVRVDSCVNAVNLVNGSGITLVDVDGDYCTDSLITIGDGVAQNKTVTTAVLLGIHGRCCTLKSYNNTQGSSPDVRELVDTSGYGMIRVLKNCVLSNSYIVFNQIGNSNPFDTSSDYRTPLIALTMSQEGSNTNAQRNQIRINSSGVSTADDIKKVIQTKTNMTCKVDIATGTFFVDGSNVSTYALAT